VHDPRGSGSGYRFTIPDLNSNEKQKQRQQLTYLLDFRKWAAQVHKLSTAKSGRFAPLARKTGSGDEATELADAANERERELRLQMDLAEQEVGF